jgi:hypothetical protein
MGLTNVDVFIDDTISILSNVVFIAMGVQCPRIKINWLLMFISTDVIPTSNDSNSHIIQSPHGHCTIQDGNGEIGGVECITSVE